MSPKKCILAASFTAVTLLAANATAQTCGVHDNFDSYPPGPLNNQGGWITSDTASIVTAQAFSEPNSLHLGHEGEAIRVVGFDSGTWDLEMMTYVSSTHHTNASYAFGYLVFDNHGSDDFLGFTIAFDSRDGYVHGSPDGRSTPMQYDQWVRVNATVDLENNRLQLFYDGHELADSLYDIRLFAEPTFDAIEFFGDATNGFYVDDLHITEQNRCPADFNRDDVANTLDFLAYLNAYNNEDPCADRDHNGIVNTLDFLLFLNDFNTGC